MLSRESGEPRVREFPSSTDPGGLPAGAPPHAASFQVRTGQQWAYGLQDGPNPRSSRPAFFIQPGGVLRDGEVQRILQGTREDGRIRDDSVNSAMHSGTAGNEGMGYASAGCQVVHGAWYPSYVEQVRRADGRAPVRLVYTLLDGHADLPPP